MAFLHQYVIAASIPDLAYLGNGAMGHFNFRAVYHRHGDRDQRRRTEQAHPGCPGLLEQAAASEGAIRSAAFLAFLMGVACAGIGLALYPIMRRYSIGLAMGVVGFRLIEGIGDMLGGLSYVALLALSREFVRAGATDAAAFETIGAIINTASAWINNGVVLICWCIGAFMYYGVFYRYRLVPRWISAWGLIGITLTTISGLLVMAGLIPGFGTIQLIANLPIAPQEMVFAAWLIAKGVNLSAAPALNLSGAAPDASERGHFSASRT